MTEPPAMTKHLVDLEQPYDPDRPRDYDEHELVRFALASGDYWADLALAWLEACSPSVGLVPALEDAARNLSLPQAVRHRAQRLVKKLRPLPWTAWANDGPGLAVIEEALQLLAGKRITGCRYVILDIEGSVDDWSTPACDVLGFGLELDLDNQESWSITWAQAGYKEGLSIRPGHLVPESVSDAATIDVRHRWADLGPTVVGWIEATWTELCLTSLVLGGNDERCAVVTLFGADTIRVYFSREAARADGVELASSTRPA